MQARPPRECGKCGQQVQQDLVADRGPLVLLSMLGEKQNGVCGGTDTFG